MNNTSSQAPILRRLYVVRARAALLQRYVVELIRDALEVVRSAGREAIPGLSLVGYLVYLASKFSPKNAWLVTAIALYSTLAIITGHGSTVLERVAIETFVLAVAAIGIYSFAGTTGILSFGHAAFMG
ncbi:MAG: hypothetical protein ACT4TC_00600, partial [Myxococcaceae bacterium]